MIIKIDVDGVIRDIYTPMNELYNTTFNENITVDDISYYDVNKVYNKLNGDAVNFFFRENANYVFNKGAKPYSDAKQSIDILREYGHKVLIVTYQETIANKIDTIRFLERYDIEYDALFFTKDKELIHGDYVVDDNPSFLKACTEKKICINAPYNKDYHEIGLVKCCNLLQAVKYIINNNITA